MGFAIRSVEKARDFPALAPIWARLMRDSGQTSPFLSYDWFWCCWHGVWPQRRPEILVVEDRGSPVAIIPLMHWKAWVGGLPVRCVGFLEGPTTPMVDIVTAGPHDRVLETFLAHLTSRTDWDTAWLQKLPATSPTVKALEATLPGRLPWQHAGQRRHPYVAIEGDWAQFLAEQSQSFTARYRQTQAQLKEAGEVHLEAHHQVELQSPVWQEALAVMRRHRPLDSSVALGTRPRTTEFFRELTRRAAKRGWLALWVLRLNGRVVAIEYQLRANGMVHALWAGEDPASQGRLPTQALSLVMLPVLFEGGRVYEYQSPPGADLERLWWANGSHELIHLQLYRPGLYARVLQRWTRPGVPGPWQIEDHRST